MHQGGGQLEHQGRSLPRHHVYYVSIDAIVYMVYKDLPSILGHPKIIDHGSQVHPPGKQLLPHRNTEAREAPLLLGADAAALYLHRLI